MDTPFSDPRKAEIWATVRAINDAWTTGDPDTLGEFFHPQMVAVTATDHLRREGAAACIAGWKSFAAAATIHHWGETAPLIHIYGESAVVAYYYDLACDIGGQPVELSGRDLFFFIRENGRWWAVADQFSAYPG